MLRARSAFAPAMPATIALALVAACPVWAQEKYYVLIFAAQGQPAPPRRAHTFAAFIKATDPVAARADQQDTDEVDQAADSADKGSSDAGVPSAEAGPQLEVHTISWLPATMNIVPRLRPERGRNFELPMTLQWARRQGFRISVWGPFEIDRQLFDHALRKIERLDSGAFRYRMIDTSQRNVSTSNCIHAVADVVPGPPLNFGTAYGDKASLRAASHYRPWIRDPQQTHDWLYARLGLERFDVQRRNW